MSRIGFFVKAGRHFAKRMEKHKFVNTNLLIDPFNWEVSLLQEFWHLLRGLIKGKYRIFFSLEKIAVTHSLNFRKICIFFPNTGRKKNIAVFFFSQKKDYTSLTHSFQTFVFFFRHWKKNTVFLLSHSILDEIVTKVIFSRNKKKYGTFGCRYLYFFFCVNSSARF